MRMLLPAALLAICPLAIADEAPKGKGLTLSEDEKGVLDRTNAERKAAGLAPLAPNAKLFAAARAHSANMAKQEKLAHELDGKKPHERVKDSGYTFAATGENIAWNSPTPEDTLKLWMNSPGHKANILNEDYTEIGVGVATSEKGERYWTQVFGKPR